MNPRGFIEISRIEGGYRPVEERTQDYDEIELMLSEDERRLQASRCMDWYSLLSLGMSGTKCHAGMAGKNRTGGLARCIRNSAIHQQLPEIYRTCLSGSLRSVLCAVHQ